MTKPQQNKEQAILKAAEREFLTKGYAGARTTSIAEAAGVTHAMLTTTSARRNISSSGFSTKKCG